MYTPLRTAASNSTRMDYINTANSYKVTNSYTVTFSGGLVRYPPATKCALLVKYIFFVKDIMKIYLVVSHWLLLMRFKDDGGGFHISLNGFAK